MLPLVVFRINTFNYHSNQEQMRHIDLLFNPNHYPRAGLLYTVSRQEIAIC